MDFGDNVLSHYLGTEDIEEDGDDNWQLSEEYNILKKYIPISVLKFLITN